MAFGYIQPGCHGYGSRAGTASLAFSALQGGQEDIAPHELNATAKRTIVGDPLLINQTPNYTDVQATNTLRAANQFATGATQLGCMAPAYESATPQNIQDAINKADAMDGFAGRNIPTHLRRVVRRRRKKAGGRRGGGLVMASHPQYVGSGGVRSSGGGGGTGGGGAVVVNDQYYYDDDEDDYIMDDGGEDDFEDEDDDEDVVYYDDQSGDEGGLRATVMPTRQAPTMLSNTMSQQYQMSPVSYQTVDQQPKRKRAKAMPMIADDGHEIACNPVVPGGFVAGSGMVGAPPMRTTAARGGRGGNARRGVSRRIRNDYGIDGALV